MEDSKITHILQVRDRYGLIRTIAKSKDAFSQEEVAKQYPPGYYCAKETSPRFRVDWKGWIGRRGQRDETLKPHTKELLALKKKNTYLAWGEAILAVGEIVGFGLSASNFISHAQRIDRIESIIAIINAQNPLGVVCPTCLRPLSDPIDTFCGNCGNKFDWSDARRSSSPRSQLCPYCSHPVKTNQHFCTRCGRLLAAEIYPSTLRFVPVNQWRLP